MSPPTRLLFVLKGYPRLSETFIAQEMHLLEELGLPLEIVSMRPPRESVAHEIVARIKSRPYYLPEYIRAAPWRMTTAACRVLARRPWPLLALLGEALWRSLATRRTASLKHVLQACLVVRDVLDLDGRGVHVHAHFAHSPASVARNIARLAGGGFSISAHAKDIYTQDPAALSAKVRAARFVVTCTGAGRDYLERVSGRRVSLVHHGLNLAAFAPKPADAVPGSPLRLLSVARLTAKKGYPTVLRALAILAGQGVDFRYAAIGEGEEREALTQLARELGIADRVEFRGAATHDVVKAELARADVFVLGCEITRNGDRDGIPNALAEAMACGVPVVSTRLAGVMELVEDGRSGLLADPGDAPGLAERLGRLAADRDLWRALSLAGRRRVEEVFDAGALIVRLHALFCRELGYGRAASPVREAAADDPGPARDPQREALGGETA